MAEERISRKSFDYVGPEEVGQQIYPACEEAQGTGAAWGALLVGTLAGLLAAAFAVAGGNGFLVALISYIVFSLLCFVLSLAFIYSVHPETGGKPAALEATAANGEAGPRDAANLADHIVWVQRDPKARSITDERIFCVSSAKKFSIGIQLADLVVQGGYGVDLCNCLETATSTIIAEPRRWSTLFVDLDECERLNDIEDIVSDLMIFRYAVPEVAVVVCSSSFARDDLGAERLAIADISLRKPVSALKVLESIAVANENNQQWRAREGMSGVAATVAKREIVSKDNLSPVAWHGE